MLDEIHTPAGILNPPITRFFCGMRETSVPIGKNLEEQAKNSATEIVICLRHTLAGWVINKSIWEGEVTFYTFRDSG